MREQVTATPRRAFTPKQRTAVWNAQNGFCGRCGRLLDPSDMEVDHRIQIWLGGAHEPSNWVGLHSLCHRQGKTPEDATIRAKTKRLIAKADPATRKKTRRPIKSRGFDRSLRKKLDGSVVRR